MVIIINVKCNGQNKTMCISDSLHMQNIIDVRIADWLCATKRPQQTISLFTVATTAPLVVDYAAADTE